MMPASLLSSTTIPAAAPRSPGLSSNVRQPVSPAAAVLLFLLLLVGQAPTAVWACLRLPHEWTTLDHEPPTPTPGYFGLTDALYAWREEMLAASPPLDLGRLRLLRVWQGDLSMPTPAAASLRQQVAAALAAVFPTASLTIPLADLPSANDPALILPAHPDWTETVFLDIYVKRNDQHGLTMLDIIFFGGALVRTVLREETHLIVRAVGRDGQVLDVREISVSPTILVDTMMGLGGCLLTYLEKHDHRPMLLDIGELFQDVASGAYDLRPADLRQPDLPTSQPMPPPRATTPRSVPPSE
ncbi:MAG: hypothetical protein OZSIB_3430 [Candidatus Ozemobacter sibiricus]|jgi:hypothetical protein|uniref:Uncharacterized protein n=1 Tax=Candidatus Ozemobacter sibiricus TaxID=2268124 RepID=A0A367ZQ36_9BACT|nr:MAG: hypothetical protein OZSIB_3430 [Candidatus Ozemobacter sibiricus]